MLWGVTCHFNPAGFEQPVRNLEVFVGRVRAQGLPLMMVELAFGDAEFSLDESLFDAIVRVRSDEVLWHKEALLNLGVSRLPDDCDAVAWLDADLVFDNDGWVRDTRTALEEHRVVQPFAHCVWLPPGVERVDLDQTRYPSRGEEYSRHHSFGFAWKNLGPYSLEARDLYGHVGFAWAARREILETVGLYDAQILGNGDDLMAHAFVGNETMLRNEGDRLTSGQRVHYERWAERAYAAVRGEVGYVDGTLFHLWHGSRANRQFGQRWGILRDADFDPEVHLEHDENGLCRLRDAPPGMREAIREYFVDRAEDTVLPAPKLRDHAGFFADEGEFRWAGQHAGAVVNQHLEDLTISVSNNAQDRFDRPQHVTAFVNGVAVADVELPDTSPQQLSVGRVRAGDEVALQADFSFSPSQFGAADTRQLAFMLWND